MNMPILCTKCGNKIWYVRALVYFNNYKNSGGFCGEFNYIRKELGVIKEYIPKPKNE